MQVATLTPGTGRFNTLTSTNDLSSSCCRARRSLLTPTSVEAAQSQHRHVQQPARGQRLQHRQRQSVQRHGHVYHQGVEPGGGQEQSSGETEDSELQRAKTKKRRHHRHLKAARLKTFISTAASFQLRHLLHKHLMTEPFSFTMCNTSYSSALERLMVVL